MSSEICVSARFLHERQIGIVWSGKDGVGAERVQSVAFGFGGMARTEQSRGLMSHNPNHETGCNRTGDI